MQIYVALNGKRYKSSRPWRDGINDLIFYPISGGFQWMSDSFMGSHVRFLEEVLKNVCQYI